MALAKKYWSIITCCWRKTKNFHLGCTTSPTVRYTSLTRFCPVSSYFATSSLQHGFLVCFVYFCSVIGVLFPCVVIHPSIHYSIQPSFYTSLIYDCPDGITFIRSTHKKCDDGVMLVISIHTCRYKHNQREGTTISLRLTHDNLNLKGLKSIIREEGRQKV